MSKDLSIKNRIFGFFRASDRPDAEEEDTTPNLKRYFKLLGRRFWKLISLNLVMLPMVLPILIILMLNLNGTLTPTSGTPAFPQMYGASFIEQSPVSEFCLNILGRNYNVPVHGTWTYIGIGVCAVFLLVTFGWQNVGSFYVLRSIVRGEPVFILSDYFYAVRRNLKQGLILGIIDAVIIALLVFDIDYFWGLVGSFWYDVGFFAVCAMAILYFFMRFYLYLMLVTFDLSIRKLFKNALIFAALGIKRNLVAALGIIILTAINVVLLVLLLPIGNAIPLILPAIYYLSFTAFTGVYGTYPVIDRYMIAPFRNRDGENEDAPEDTGTETAEPTEE